MARQPRPQPPKWPSGAASEPKRAKIRSGHSSNAMRYETSFMPSRRGGRRVRGGGVAVCDMKCRVPASSSASRMPTRPRQAISGECCKRNANSRVNASLRVESREPLGCPASASDLALYMYVHICIYTHTHMYIYAHTI